jgi:hypothetical protein
MNPHPAKSSEHQKRLEDEILAQALRLEQSQA